MTKSYQLLPPDNPLSISLQRNSQFRTSLPSIGHINRFYILEKRTLRRRDRSYPGHPEKAPHINPYMGKE
jgi:hypothetical protein